MISENRKINKETLVSFANFETNIIDHGIKSIDSVLSKIYRKTKIELNHNFSIRDIKDIIRCTIIIDNYNQAIPLIRAIRKNIPTVCGDVCENETGYIGIHMSLTINNFPSEIQVTTKEAWEIKQKGSQIYSKWRDFHLHNELKKIDNYENKKEYIQLLFSHHLQKSFELNMCKKMFSSLHKNTNLNKLKDAINAVLHVNNYTHKEEQNDTENIYNIKIKDLNNTELLNNCQNYLLLAQSAKEDIIEYASKALQIVKNSKKAKNNGSLNKQEKKFIILRKRYFNRLNKRLTNKFNHSFDSQKYISKINKIANKLTLNAINPSKMSNSIQEDIINLEEQIQRDIKAENYFFSLVNFNNDN